MSHIRAQRKQFSLSATFTNVFAANNPTLDAITEIHEYNMALLSVNRKSEAVPTSIVVSLGTGLPPTTELKEIDVFRPDSIWDTAKLAYGISAIGNLLVDQATVSGFTSILLIQPDIC